MPLVEFRPAPGINKEVTDYRKGKWTDGDNVMIILVPHKYWWLVIMFKISLVGAARDQHTWVDLEGTIYFAV